MNDDSREWVEVTISRNGPATGDTKRLRHYREFSDDAPTVGEVIGALLESEHSEGCFAILADAIDYITTGDTELDPRFAPLIKAARELTSPVASEPAPLASRLS